MAEMLGAQLESLHCALLLQQRRADNLAAQQRRLFEENGALRECLEMAGVLRVQTFFTQLHKRRFAQVLERHPLEAHAVSLAAVTHTHELAFSIARHAGPDAVGQLGLANRRLKGSVASITPELSAVFPSAVFVVGGSGDGTRGPLSTAERFSLGADDASDDSNVTAARAPALVSSMFSSRACCSMLSSRACCATVARDGCIYVIAGHNSEGIALSSAERFDIRSEQWSKLPSLSRTRGWIAAAISPAGVCVMGGEREDMALSCAEALCAQSHDGIGWTPLPHMQTARYAACAASAGGCMYVTGGYGVDDIVSNAVECLSFGARHWRQLPPMRCARAAHAMTALKGRIYVVGGYDAEERCLASMECFDPLYETWNNLPEMCRPQWGLGAVACHGYVYVMGGKTGQSLVNTATVRRYDPKAQKWQIVGRLRIGRRCFGVAACR